MLDIYLSNEIRLFGLPKDAAAVITRALSIPNPKFVANRKYGRWNGNTPRLLTYYKTIKNSPGRGTGLIIPRGFAFHLFHILKARKLTWNLLDGRLSLPEADFVSRIRLKSYQAHAVKQMLKKDFGVLNAPTGSGKTVMACHLIAERKQPTLVIVHTKELLNQWISRIETFLGVRDIGIIGAGKYSFGDITVGLVQTLCKRDLSVIAKHFGHIIVDECHRIPSRTFACVLANFYGKYQLGLSATPYRSDGLSKLILYYVGNVVHNISETSLVETGQILRAEVVSRKTDFRYNYRDEADYQPMISALTEDRKRNLLIVSDVIEESKKGEYCIVLSDRKAHCYTLGEMLENAGVDCSVLIGETPKPEREAIIHRLEAGTLRVVIATGQLLGEGFDCKKLSRIFLTLPMKYRGRIKQYIGRVLRTCRGKDGAKVYDYVDAEVGVLYAIYKSRNNVLHHLS